VRFHDGTLLTADAVIASLEQSCNAACPWTSVHAIGTSVVFTGDNPMPDLPAQLARAQFLISHRDAQRAIDGTGPFAVTGFSGGIMTLAANDDYWAGRPFVDTVEIRPKRSIRDQWLDLNIGRADIVEVPPELLRQAQQQHLTVIPSTPVDLLVLQIAGSGSLTNQKLRQAIALAIDRGALYNVIFQKQGEVTASLLPNRQSGYSFLFSTDRNLNRAQELRGGATPPQLTLACEDSSAELQLAAERIALNLREAGFRIEVAAADHSRADILLLRVHLEEADPQSALDEMLERFGHTATGSSDMAAIFREERDLLVQFEAVPLLYLPRAYAIGERVRDLHLAPDGTPLLEDVSLEDAK
jgi:peptide/nickel transport system substrate-binding protein